MHRHSTVSAMIALFALGTPAMAADASSAQAQPSAPAAQSAQARARAVDDPALQWNPCPPLFAPGCQIAVLQGEPSQPNAAVFFRIPGGYAIPAHSHTSAEHLVLVAGELDVHYKGSAAISMKIGDYAYGPPGLPHLGHCRSKTPCTLFIAFERPVDASAYEGRIP